MKKSNVVVYSMGSGIKTPTLISNNPFPNIVQIFDHGSNHFILLSDGRVFVKGKNNCYQLGLGDSIPRTEWTPLLFSDKIESIQIQYTPFSCLFLTESGNVYLHQYALSEFEKEYQKHVPFPILSKFKHRRIVAKNGSFFIQTEKNDLYVFGQNTHKRLGLKKRTTKFSISQLSFFKNLSPIVSIEPAVDFTLFLLQNEDMYGCGSSFIIGKPNGNDIVSPILIQKGIQYVYSSRYFAIYKQSSQWFGMASTISKGEYVYQTFNSFKPERIDRLFPDLRVKKVLTILSCHYLLCENGDLYTVGIDGNGESGIVSILNITHKYSLYSPSYTKIEKWTLVDKNVYDIQGGIFNCFLIKKQFTLFSSFTFNYTDLYILNK